MNTQQKSAPPTPEEALGAETPQPAANEDALKVPFQQGEAESHVDSQQEQQTTPTFTLDDLERVRKEEKDKLYPRLEEMKTELKELRKIREEQQRQAEEEEKRLAEEAKRKEEEEMELRTLLQKKEQEWTEKFSSLQQEREQERALLDKERHYQTLIEYRRKRIDEESENLMPELRDLVTGNTEDEIEASLASLKSKTASIIEQVQQAQQGQRAQMKGVAVTAPTGIGPIENNETNYQTMTAEDIRNMDMQTYAKYRDRLKQAATARGPYGR